MVKSLKDMALRYFKLGLTVEEVASRLGISQEKVKEFLKDPELYKAHKEGLKRREESLVAPLAPDVREAEYAGLIELEEIMNLTLKPETIPDEESVNFDE